MKKVLFLFGTRPEAIKMIPLIKECEKHPDIWQTRVCVTGQHKQMLAQVLSFFEVQPDEDLALMKPNQTLFDITADGLQKMKALLEREQPDVVVVQGDTTSAFTGALAAYYKQIKVAHIEAGLRSGNKYSPFPEEMNRKLAGAIADFHFAPTPNAEHNLQQENITAQVYVTGNTVIDALFLALEQMKDKPEYAAYFSFLQPDKKIILLTGHRRESFGQPFEEMCTAIKTIAEKYADSVQIVYPVHLNPQVQEPVRRILGNHPNIHLIDPLEYPYLIWLMQQSYLVLTDSGGIQEEAPSLGKPVLVMREVTERTEGIEAGTAKLVGTRQQDIIDSTVALLEDASLYQQMAQAKNPYGDGKSAELIMNILAKQLQTVK
ncbi:UDP-N-acetylglucosamine 2-epimerase (non-hydrolyzing) [Chitinophaga agrisoli]|uniref:UDP-N-acetylglucosamine 2-epimerase (non-hydrolyzing) n=1 Tax=Chitinophaga agrisoli TaxID=2607653 RepID=A0A5B2VJX1_9BACT|nr:UDP-N-acetylglucosamine 2-epimerase (non-hydrolyzing) [Chitinophaga agrisoli]KAA2239144.1 UDP-N-acetylglucosamine 2-epimerase (non-hydrolyzing) [Chitinophaga agrisoli]